MDPAQAFSGDSSHAAGEQTGFTPATGEGGEQPASVDPVKLQEALSHFQGENQNLRSELEGLKSSGASQAEILEKIKSVFVPENVDPNQQAGDIDRSFLDGVLEAALEDQKQGGRGMPITVQLAGQIVQLKEQIRQMGSSHDEIKGKFEKTQDPVYEAEQRFGLNMDNMVDGMLHNIYGAESPHMKQAITQQMLADIPRLKQQYPQQWQVMIKSPQKQQEFAQYYVEKSVPPKARELLHQHKVQSTEMPASELYQALKEAKEAHADGKLPSDQYRTIQTQIREKILEESYMGAHRR